MLKLIIALQNLLAIKAWPFYDMASREVNSGGEGGEGRGGDGRCGYGGEEEGGGKRTEAGSIICTFACVDNIWLLKF